MSHRYLLFFSTLMMIASSFSSCRNSRSAIPPYDPQADMEQRLDADFSWTKEQVMEYLSRFMPDVTEEQVDAWTKSGALENMTRHGKVMYYSRAASNLMRLDSTCHACLVASEKSLNDSKQGTSLNKDAEMKPVLLRSIAADTNTLCLPRRLHVKSTITVQADAVPEGEIIRCWMPYPRTDITRQTDVQLLCTSSKATEADANCTHHTLYMEQPACKGQPTVFSAEYYVTCYAEYHAIDRTKILPYDTTSALYRTYTAEREKHIRFSPTLRHISDSLTQGMTNPMDKMESIFRWVSKTFPWAGAREYSTLDNIPEYMLQVKHGDCGQKTLMLLTLARIAGIPCRFESGLTTAPSGYNLHDWGEVYYEPFGWIPVDVSEGPQDENGVPELFYLSGVDNWRMTVNSDYGMPLQPTKTYPRSDDVDLQRGEVEWRGGNLYFTEWKYRMEYTEEP